MIWGGDSRLTEKLAALIILDHFPRWKGPLSFILYMTESIDEPSSRCQGKNTYADGQNTRIMMGCRYPSITEIAADERIALNCPKLNKRKLLLRNTGLLTAITDAMYAQEIKQPMRTESHTPSKGAWNRFKNIKCRFIGTPLSRARA